MSVEDDEPPCSTCEGRGLGTCPNCGGTGKEPPIYYSTCGGPFYGFHACEYSMVYNADEESENHEEP